MRILAGEPPPGAIRISLEEQTERWVRGESVHRLCDIELVDDQGRVTGTIPNNECTPALHVNGASADFCTLILSVCTLI